VHGTARNVTVSDGFAYVSYGYSGWRVIDISDPENLNEIGHYNNDVYVYEIAISNDYAYIANGTNGLRIVSISDPEDPEEIGCYNVRGYIVGVTISGEYAYLANREWGFRVICISDPENPEEVGYLDDSSVRVVGVTVSGNYVHIAYEERGLRVVNISDPENPEDVGYYNTPGVAKNVAVSENGLIYVADYTNLGIYRFTDPASIDDGIPQLVTNFALNSVYPNPFNSQFSFNIHLPQSDIVEFHLYDVTGRELWSLSERLGVGVHQKSVDLNLNSAGVYFLKAESVFGSEIQRVVMLK